MANKEDLVSGDFREHVCSVLREEYIALSNAEQDLYSLSDKLMGVLPNQSREETIEARKQMDVLQERAENTGPKMELIRQIADRLGIELSTASEEESNSSE